MEALSIFRKIIQTNPNVPLDVHYCISMCFLKLGDIPKAISILEKIIVRNENHINSLVALALIKGSYEGVLTYSNEIFNAFNLNMNNPHVLICLGEIFFYRLDLD